MWINDPPSESSDEDNEDGNLNLKIPGTTEIFVKSNPGHDRDSRVKDIKNKELSEEEMEKVMIVLQFNYSKT